MAHDNCRILLHITMLPRENPVETQKVDTIYCRVNDSLDGTAQLPNVSNLCQSYDKMNSKLAAYIRNSCFDMEKDDIVFRTKKEPQSMLAHIEGSKRKKIRILLYPGVRRKIKDLNIQETTHNMIIQFEQIPSKFWVTEAHENPPSFYQSCDSVESALRYLEALMIDACLCHYLGISDVAYHHDEKQRISREKVHFLREMASTGQLGFLSDESKKIVNYVVSKVRENTPYISFFSIFTIAIYDVFGNKVEPTGYFPDYFKLWNRFQKWYFEKHDRLFHKHNPVENAVEVIFARNKYLGQISRKKLDKEINKLLEKDIIKAENPPFGYESRFAIIVIKHLPSDQEKAAQFSALFSGKIHTAKWDIVYWNDLEKYKMIRDCLEIIPIIID